MHSTKRSLFYFMKNRGRVSQPCADEEQVAQNQPEWNNKDQETTSVKLFAVLAVAEEWGIQW